MWIQTTLVLIYIALSHQTCQINDNFFISSLMSRYILYCTDLNQNYDLYADIMSKNHVETIIISDSNIPKLNQDLFHDIKFRNMKIEAKVRVIESKAFEKCIISTLTLSNNNIELIIGDSFPTSLQYLNLQNNSLSEIKVNHFTGLSRLKELNLKYNKILNIEEGSFDPLTYLSELDLSFNRLTELPFEVFKNLTNLSRIYLNDNFIKGLSDNIFSQCTFLVYLYIQNNAITIIDAGQYPTSLSYVNASGNQLTSIDFSNLVNVGTFDLSFNNLTTILGWMYNLPSLTFLYLNYNSLGPSINTKSFHHLKNLTTIELGSNNLQGIDIELFDDLPILTSISLADNNLSNFLDFANLNAPLAKLNLSRNSLDEVRNLSKFPNLIYLDLSYNNIEIKYDMFQNLKKLERLVLQHNSIHTLPLGCFRDLNELEELNLAHNNITSTVPGVFTGLKSLSALDISYNRISHLDASSFHDIKYLSKLNIAYNNITKVEILHLIGNHLLAKVELEGNNWTCKDLSQFIKMYTSISISRGSSYNVTNVYGVACNNSDNNDKHANSSVNLSIYLESINEHAKEVSYKMTVNNIVLIVLLICLCVKFTSAKCFSWFTTAKQFYYTRYRNEQEIQLS